MSEGRQLHHLFEDRAREFPEKLAVCVGRQQITYGELNARADSLAVRLRDLEVKRDVLVGLCVDRSIHMIVGLLGILKAGGAYVPIDPSYPKKRIDFLLADSGASVVVAVSGTLDCLQGCNATLVRVDEGLQAAAPDGGNCRHDLTRKNDNAAYVIYTSGSTGLPKGVVVEHHNVVRLFEQTSHWFRFDARDIWMMFHSISFDFSIWEIWGALLHGGKLVIAPLSVIRSPEQLRRLIRAEEVTILCQTPSAFQQLIAAEFRNPDAVPYPLRLIIFGGEALDLKALRPWAERYGLQRPALINMYGITETTVHVTYKPITANDLARPELNPIGTPIPDLHVHLLDDAGRPVSDGLPGEIHVSGGGVARGYLNRLELTSQRFPVCADGTRMYRSGDRAVRLPNGELAYLGRADDQIKVRGFRIEPREIELCLGKHSEVSSVSLLAHDCGEGDVRLVAFAVARPHLELTPANVREIRASLAARAAAELPAHMRPSAYYVLREFPLTPHGKIDREQLSRLAAQVESDPGERIEVMNPTERTVIRIWEEIMQRQDIGLHDDFFHVGGTSLALMRILLRVNEHFGIQLDGSELGEPSSISRLASCVDEAQRKTRESTLVEEQ